MNRLTFDGNFCDIAMCQEVRGGSFCEDGDCSQRRVWEKLKQYEDTGFEPDEIDAVARMASKNLAQTAAAIDRLVANENSEEQTGCQVW